MPIIFHNADTKFSVPEKNKLKRFITSQVLRATNKKISVNYIFCSDDYLLEINKKFLKHDYYTDIITFPLSETENIIEAEIYISVERVRENAGKLKVDFEEEMRRVIFHGVLHLIGFRDKTKGDKEMMRKKEEAWLLAFRKYNP